jgi:hypothetical protein
MVDILRIIYRSYFLGEVYTYYCHSPNIKSYPYNIMFFLDLLRFRVLYSLLSPLNTGAVFSWYKAILAASTSFLVIILNISPLLLRVNFFF